MAASPDPAARTVLVVDDDVGHRTMLVTLLRDLGVDVLEAGDGDQALDVLGREAPAFVILDMVMPRRGGMATLEAMAGRGLSVPVIVLTAHADLDQAVAAMKLGARDYLRKPIDIASLEALVDRFAPRAAADPSASSRAELPGDVVVHDPLMQQVVDDVRRVADSDVSVLLTGETGTGKEVIARLLHLWSRRRDGPLVPVNVSAIPDALVESEFFGHARGAFTGATGERTGHFEAASGGTLFLDEMGDMPLDVQPKLLRVLQDGRLTRVGESRERTVDVRLVSATHRDLEAEVAAGRFRQDLYYRIAVITLEVPPLRERTGDILPLAARFLEASGRGRRLSPAAQARLLGHTWPGNVRELQNAMLRAATLAAGDVVLPEHLPPAVQAAVEAPLGDAARSLAEIEKRAILETLERTGGNRSEAARILGISRRKLLYRLKEYGGGK